MAKNQTSPVLDQWQRPLQRLRLSVTDQCNLRCRYCMPDEHFRWLPHKDVLSFAEIERLVDIFAELGVHRVHLTGGEPLLRPDVEHLVQMLARDTRIDDLSMISNGVALAQKAAALKEAGLHRMTISLDTLRPERFRNLARRDRHAQVLAGIRAAQAAGLKPLKINAVVMRGINDDELPDLVEFARQHAAEVRFIEYMDVAGATRWSSDLVVPQEEICARIARCYGPITAVEKKTSAPAQSFLLPDGTRFGVIASVSGPFCSDCDRSRLTADGTWFLCLYASRGINLRSLLRCGTDSKAIRSLVARAWQARDDRGAEERGALADRDALYSLEELHRDSHRQMHTLGG